MSFLDKLNVVIIERGFAGHNDGDAIAHALTLCATHAIEITQDDRLVGSIPKGAHHHVAGNQLPAPGPGTLARCRPMEISR
jgi:hypothetical protein